MGSLREIVDAEAVGRLFALLALVCPLLGAGVGIVLGVRRRDIGRGVRTGLLFGLIGPLNWLLWKLYNALTDANGLDTVRNLFINLTVFVVVGALIGFGIVQVRLRTADRTRSEGNSSDTPQ
ncbi:MAG TPA: hypothetical protein VKU00_08725 [Chthonomonadaceae bacterium]|nr:hypothetical protein [Chthonomonadaceae bacterium]